MHTHALKMSKAFLLQFALISSFSWYKHTHTIATKRNTNIAFQSLEWGIRVWPFFIPRHMGSHTPIFEGSECLVRISVCSWHLCHCWISASGSLKSKHDLLCMCTHTRPRFKLSSERVSNGSKVSCSRKRRNGSSSPGAGSNPWPLGWQVGHATSTTPPALINYTVFQSNDNYQYNVKSKQALINYTVFQSNDNYQYNVKSKQALINYTVFQSNDNYQYNVKSKRFSLLEYYFIFSTGRSI
jgi:hypothetical protein